jgi:predicted HAD superfamily phosphohydrolase YqeG
MKKKNLKPSQCAAIGDQVFTDVLAAHLEGCIAVVVSPIKDLENLFFRSKRTLERPFMAYYRFKNREVK